METTMSTPSQAEDWAFIDPWFKILKGLVRIADPERHDTPGAVLMGRDPETDWWLEIDWSKDLLFKSQPEIETKLKRRRDALLITSVLASADNRLWLKKLRELSGFVPAPFMDLTAHDLRPNYQFRIQRRHPLIFVDWDKTMKFLCGCESRTEGFHRHLRRAARLSHGKEIVRPRLQLHVCVPATPATVQDGQLTAPVKEHNTSFLVLLEATIQQIQATNQLPVERPHFVLDSLHLDMRALFEHADVIRLLERIVLLGVHFGTICLPLAPQADDERFTPEWRESWISFVTALGNHHPTNSTRPRVSIRRLMVGRLEIVTPEFVSLCSAMLRADNVKMLQIGEIVEEFEVDGGTEFFPPGVWELITAMFLSHNSCQSLESLSVYRVSISEDDADGIFHIIGVVNPLQFYFEHWVARGEPRPSNSTLYGVRILAGTVVTSEFGFDDNSEYSITTATDLDVILFGSDGEKADIFVDGRGFCTVPRRALAKKRTRLSLNDFSLNSDESATAKLKSLELISVPGDTTTRNHLHDIFEFAAGSPLQALRLRIPGIDEATVQSALAHCPNLQHLTISDVALDSMAIFEKAFSSEVPLRSLELGSASVPSSALEGFLDKCRSRDGHAPQFSKIQSLRLSQRLENSVLDVLSQVARDPHSNLRYLHYYVAEPDQASYKEIAEATNGMPIAEVREPLPASSRWAFLQALHHVEQGRPGLVLTDDLKALICSMAATPNTRTVICDDSQPPQLGQGIPPAQG